MLERLGEVIRKATNRIANAIFLDKNLIDSIIRDLQRALIEADVNILLIKKISDKIKKESLDERIKGIEKKEHIIKLLHDELVNILGEHIQLKLKKGQNRVMLLGLYGAGKCVHEKSKIQLSDGNIIQAKDLYKKYCKESLEDNLKDGKVINIENKSLFVPSFNSKTLKIENKKATHLWKLKKQDLIEVKLNNGNDYSIKVTPEHPFFVLRNGKVVQIRADKLSEDDFISLPNTIETRGAMINLFNEIKDFDLYAYLSPEETKKYFSKNKSLKEICQNLKYKKNYCQFTSDLKKGKIPLELIGKKKHNFLRLKNLKGKKVISFPLYLTQEFAEFIGYVIGDGHITNRYIGITSEDPEIIKRLIELSKLLFNINPTITKDKRTKNLHQVRLNSGTLVEIFKIFGLSPGKKGKNLKVPKQIIISDNETVKSFIKAYFDCDSSPAKNKRNIELTSESKSIIQQISLLLRRFGALSTISKKIVNGNPYWRLFIKGRYAEIYSEKIGYLINRKKKIVDTYKKIGEFQGVGNQDMIPLQNILKVLRMAMGFSIGEIQENAVYSYGTYEQKGFISREKLRKLILYYKLRKRGIFLNILEYLSNNHSLTDIYSRGVVNGILKHLRSQGFIDKNHILISNKGKQYLQLVQKTDYYNLLNFLELLSTSNICWIPIREINLIKNDSKYVYDLTVEDNHSFIAEGIIVHNTTTIAKLGNYFSKRGNKVALISLDVHRPAAKEQLKQLAERNKLTCFIDEKENNAVKTWKKIEKDLKKYDLVLIDTAGRHSLDKNLIKEIIALNKEIKPTESILVMPADIGQAAKKQAQEFQEAVKISGVIITRMDSTAKGGGALTACGETKAPVYFITTGEKINDLEEFNPKSFLSRLLGMGDLQTLIEKVKSATDEGKQEEIQKRLEEGKLTLEDVIEQVKSMGSMGGFDKIKSMIPGLGNAKIPDEMLGTQEEKIKKWEHIVKSMTLEEKNNPEILKKQTSRISRIAKGSGVHSSDVRALLKQYDMLSEMIKGGTDMDMSQGFNQKQMQKLMKKFGKKKIRRM